MREKEDLEKLLKKEVQSLEINEEMKEHLKYVHTLGEKNLTKTMHIHYKTPSLLKVASLVILILGGIGVINPSFAEEAPIFYRVFEGIHNTLFKDTKYEKYAEPTNLKAVDEGYEINIEEIVCDHRKIGFAYTITSQNKKLKHCREWEPGHLTGAFYVNGEALEYESVHKLGKYTDDYTYKGQLVMDTKEELPNQFDFKIHIVSFSGSDTRDPINVNWKLGTQVTKHTKPYGGVFTAKKEYPIKMLDGIILRLDVVDISPINTMFEVTIKGKNLNEIIDQYDIKFAFIDSLGQTYWYSGSSGFSRVDEDCYKWTMETNSIHNVPKWIGIIPSIKLRNEITDLHIPQRISQVDYTEGQTVIQRKGFGDIIIKEIKQEEEDVVIIAEPMPLQRYIDISVILNNKEKIRYYRSKDMEKGKIQLRFKNCKKEDIEALEVKDDSEEWLADQMIKIDIEPLKIDD